MSKDLEMLSVIYQNAEMGKDTITHLIEITDSVEIDNVDDGLIPSAFSDNFISFPPPYSNG